MNILFNTNISLLVVFYHSTKPTLDENDLTILNLDVVTICGGKETPHKFDLIILIILETILLVLILLKVSCQNCVKYLF